MKKKLLFLSLCLFGKLSFSMECSGDWSDHMQDPFERVLPLQDAIVSRTPDWITEAGSDIGDPLKAAMLGIPTGAAIGSIIALTREPSLGVTGNSLALTAAYSAFPYAANRHHKDAKNSFKEIGIPLFLLTGSVTGFTTYASLTQK